MKIYQKALAAGLGIAAAVAACKAPDTRIPYEVAFNRIQTVLNQKERIVDGQPTSNFMVNNRGFLKSDGLIYLVSREKPENGTKIEITPDIMTCEGKVYTLDKDGKITDYATKYPEDEIEGRAVCMFTYQTAPITNGQREDLADALDKIARDTM